MIRNSWFNAPSPKLQTVITLTPETDKTPNKHSKFNKLLRQQCVSVDEEWTTVYCWACLSFQSSCQNNAHGIIKHESVTHPGVPVLHLLCKQVISAIHTEIMIHSNSDSTTNKFFFFTNFKKTNFSYKLQCNAYNSSS